MEQFSLIGRVADLTLNSSAMMLTGRPLHVEELVIHTAVDLSRRKPGLHIQLGFQAALCCT